MHIFHHGLRTLHHNHPHMQVAIRVFGHVRFILGLWEVEMHSIIFSIPSLLTDVCVRDNRPMESLTSKVTASFCPLVLCNVASLALSHTIL